MQKWDYLTLLLTKDKTILAAHATEAPRAMGALGNLHVVLGTLGDEGWDFAGTVENGSLCVFKRPKGSS